jgi:cytidylate kinase
LKLLQDYLKAPRHAELPEHGYPYVTISRQCGAGGHLLAYVIMTDFLKQANAALFEGWHVFDKQLCEIIAADPLLHDSAETIRYERHQPEFREFLESLFLGRDNQYLAYKKTFEVVHLLASIGKVIIVGRAGCCVTRDLPNGIRIHLVAPEPVRVKWIMHRLNIAHEEARRLVEKEDAERRSMMKIFFNREMDDPLLYDAVWNTATTEMHEIAGAVIEMLKRRAVSHVEDPRRALPSNRELALFFNFSADWHV